MEDEIRNTPSSVTLEYSRWLMGREWPWHTSGALVGACMAIARTPGAGGVRAQDQKKTTGVPSRSGSERLAKEASRTPARGRERCRAKGEPRTNVARGCVA